MAFNTSNGNSVLAKLFVSGEFSDLTVRSKSGTKEFKVHRNIVCSQSKPLKAALSGNFQEAVTGIYDMDDDEPEIVHALLYFFYHSTYTPISSPIHAMVFNAKVYVIADKYDVNGLKELSSQKYKQSVKDFPEDSEAFVSSLEILYKGTPGTAPICAEAFQTAVNRIGVLVTCKAFEELCEENGNIPLEIVKAIVHADMHTFSGVTATALLNCGEIMALCEKNGKLAFGILKSFYRRNSFF